MTVGLMALLLSACGISAKPQAGTAHIKRSKNFYGRVDDPRKLAVKCLKADKYRYIQYYTRSQHLPALQVGTLPNGPTVVFEPTPGIAQGLQIQGYAQAAEIVGSALVYPNRTSDKKMFAVKACIAIGVAG